MRDGDERSGALLSYVNLEARVRRDYPPRTIRAAHPRNRFECENLELRNMISIGYARSEYKPLTEEEIAILDGDRKDWYD